MTEIYRGLDKLTLNFRQKVELWLGDVGDKIFITESRRSAERQAELYAQGRTKPGNVVTRVTHSNHQDGLAVDIAFKGDETYPSNLGKRREIADSAKKYGIDWGYDLWQTDKPHFQDNGKNINLYTKNNTMTLLIKFFVKILGAFFDTVSDAEDQTKTHEFAQHFKNKYNIK